VTTVHIYKLYLLTYLQNIWVHPSQIFMKINRQFLARDVIYASRAYLMMPLSICLSVCLWHLCIVVTGCNGSRISLHAWIDGCLYYLLTTADPDHRMWWCWDFWWNRGGLEKVVIVAISLIYLLKVWTRNRLWFWFVYVKSNINVKTRAQFPTKIFCFL